MTANKSTKTSTPAPAEQPAKAPSRRELLATLEAKGYTGPTSFTVSKLREVVAWVEAGSPKDSTSMPTGVLYAVYPDLKPAPKAKTVRSSKFQEGYQQALSDVAGLRDLASVRKWIADNQTQVKA